MARVAALLASLALASCGAFDPRAVIDIATSLRLPSKQAAQVLHHCHAQPPTGQCATDAGAIKVRLLSMEF